MSSDPSLEKAHRIYSTKLEKKLLDRVKQCSPSIYSQLILDLLESMGYGSPLEEDPKTTRGKENLSGASWSLTAPRALVSRSRRG